MAVAVPVEEITVDGDFSDWPEGMRRYAIDAINQGTMPESEVDYRSWFQVGYNIRENALYVAVGMADDSVVIGTTDERPWEEQDGCEIYLDVRHGEENTVPAQYVLWGETTNDWRGEAVGSVKRDEGIHLYEWKIDVGKNSGGSVLLRNGMSVGFDVVLIDKDAGRIASWMNWEQAETVRYIHSSRLGDLLLAAGTERLPRIAGTLAWNDGEVIPRGKVRIRSLSTEEWRQTREERVEYRGLPVGEYRFEVKAVDKDLNYSKPATVAVTVHLPYRDIVVAGGLGVALLGLVTAVGYGVKKRRDQLQAERALMQELEEELQTAHDLQMGLMPKEAPQIEGLNIAGRCLPANHVGGDFFQYHQLAPNRLAVSLADVTGHAMEAAIPVVMFSGVLESQVEADRSLEELFGRLNRTLHQSLDSRTFVCFAMGDFDVDTGRFRHANSGCPYPLHFRSQTGEVDELQVDAYPLGVRPKVDYAVEEAQLKVGDRVVFCSDGIVEAENASGELFGFERVAEIVGRGGRENLTVEGLLELIIEEVKGFSEGVAQGDDQTVVVLEVAG